MTSLKKTQTFLGQEKGVETSAPQHFVHYHDNTNLSLLNKKRSKRRKRGVRKGNLFGMSKIDFTKFLTAQSGSRAGVPGFEQAFGELRSGRKVSHWIWYILPQFLADDGRRPSTRQEMFQIQNPAMALAYLTHETLGPRYEQAVRQIYAHLETSNKLFRQAQETISKNPKIQGKVMLEVASRGNVALLMGSAVDVHKLYMTLSTFLLTCLDRYARLLLVERTQQQQGLQSPAASTVITTTTTITTDVEEGRLQTHHIESSQSSSVAQPNNNATCDGASIPKRRVEEGKEADMHRKWILLLSATLLEYLLNLHNIEEFGIIAKFARREAADRAHVQSVRMSVAELQGSPSSSSCDAERAGEETRSTGGGSHTEALSDELLCTLKKLLHQGVQSYWDKHF